MANLKTTYMGIELENPIVVAACSISSMTDRIQAAEKAGAGALVIRSLFEEQIQFEALKLEDQLSVGADSFAESLSHFPKMEHGKADEHIMWVEKARAEVDMPLIASLNAISPEGWQDFAKQLASTGVDGLELNTYAIAADAKRKGVDIEKELYQVVKNVKQQVSIPVAVKLSPFYTSTANLSFELASLGADALVLFNRFLQPDIDPDTEDVISSMTYSSPAEMKLPLRWVALLHGRVDADLALNTGVHSGKDVVKGLLAGATIVQTASALLENGIPYLSTMLRDLEGWMDEHGYDEIDDFRGKLSQKKVDDPYAYERAQYVKLLMEQ